MAFDSADIPPWGYLSAGTWQHRGDKPCPPAVPMTRHLEDQTGWKSIDGYDYDPENDGDHQVGD